MQWLNDQTATMDQGHAWVYATRRICSRGDDFESFSFFFKYEESEITKIEFMKSATKYVEEIYVRYDEHKYRNWQKFQNLSLELS